MNNEDFFFTKKKRLPATQANFVIKLAQATKLIME